MHPPAKSPAFDPDRQLRCRRGTRQSLEGNANFSFSITAGSRSRQAVFGGRSKSPRDQNLSQGLLGPDRLHHQKRTSPPKDVSMDFKRFPLIGSLLDLIAELLWADDLDPFSQDLLIQIPCVVLVQVELQLDSIQLRVEPHGDIAPVKAKLHNRAI